MPYTQGFQSTVILHSATVATAALTEGRLPVYTLSPSDEPLTNTLDTQAETPDLLTVRRLTLLSEPLLPNCIILL